MKKPLLLLTIFASMSLSFIAHAQTLATVGNSQITVEEFKRKLNMIRKKVSNPPTPEQFLEDLVKFEIAQQEARRMKLENDPVVKESFEQVLYNAVIEKGIGSKIENIKITEADMKEHYKKNPELRVAHLYIEVKPNASAEEKAGAKKRASEIFDEMKKSKRTFEDLVKLYSDDFASKEIGGDMGFVSRMTLYPSLYETALSLKVGEYRGPVEGGYGFHIVKLLDRRSYELADKRQIRAALFEDKRAKLFVDFFEKLKKNYKIKVNKDTLKSTKF